MKDAPITGASVVANSIAAASCVRPVALSLAPVGYWRLDDAGGIDVEEVGPNSGLELGNFTGWTISGGAVTIDASAPYSGLYAAQITSGAYNYLYQTLTLPVGDHIISVAVKTSGDYAPSGIGGISVELGTGVAQNPGTAGLTPSVTAGMAWTIIRKSIRVTTAGTFRILLTNTYGGTCVGSIWFDELHVYRSLARDSSGNGFHGDLWHSVTPGIVGLVPGDPASKAMALDGASGQIKLPASVQAQITNDVTIAIWLNTVTTAAGRSFFAMFQGINWLALRHAVGLLIFRTSDQVTGLQELTWNGLTYGVLHRVVVTRRSSDGQKAIYVDGIQRVVNTGDRWVAPNSGQTNLQIVYVGSRESDEFAQATLKDVLLCNYAWTPAQVSDDFLAGSVALGALTTTNDQGV